MLKFPVDRQSEICHCIRSFGDQHGMIFIALIGNLL